MQQQPELSWQACSRCSTPKIAHAGPFLSFARKEPTMIFRIGLATFLQFPLTSGPVSGPEWSFLRDLAWPRRRRRPGDLPGYHRSAESPSQEPGGAQTSATPPHRLRLAGWSEADGEADCRPHQSVSDAIWVEGVSYASWLDGAPGANDPGPPPTARASSPTSWTPAKGNAVSPLSGQWINRF